VVDYAVRPETAPPGQPKTWWDVHYKNLPDPAFKLLWRYDPEKGFALTDPRKRYLNWEIVADPRNPAVGEQTTIRVPVYNYSLLPVSNVPVRIYQGDPAAGGTLIGETVTGEIPPRGKEVVAVDWTVPNNVSRFASIYAVIDPDDTLNEVHETNNLSFNTIILDCVDCAAPNLSLAAEDIRFAPDTPTPGETVTVSATVRADRAAANVGVTFYRGDPDQGQRIGEATVLEISAGGTGVASILWDTTGLTPGAYDIWAVVAAQEGEPITEDNRASQSITLHEEGSEPANLTADGIGFTPTAPAVGDTVTLSATVSTDQAVSAIDVTFYRGDPAAGNTIGSTTIPNIAANGSATASVPWDTAGLDAGEYELWAVVAAQPGEANTDDNRTSQTITLRSAGTTEPDGAEIYLPITRQ
jgi:hypothetical protein